MRFLRFVCDSVHRESICVESEGELDVVHTQSATLEASLAHLHSHLMKNSDVFSHPDIFQRAPFDDLLSILVG